MSQPPLPRQIAALRLARERRTVSRADLAEALCLDKKAVAAVVDGLLAASLLAPAGFRGSQAGRRQELLALNPGYANYIGIDLGATHVIGLRTDLLGRPLDRLFFEIRPGLPAPLILEQMQSIGAALAASGKATAPLRAAGVCAPGFMDPATGASLQAENIPGWRDVRLREIFQERFGVPVRTEDSSRAWALAERTLGEGRDGADFLLADLGYGIGLAAVCGGRLFTGSAHRSGELGHTVVVPGGRDCACGNRGCLETVASGRAIAGDAAQGIRDGRSELLRGLTQDRPDTVTAQDAAVAASLGDPFSLELLRAAGRAIGAALANAVNLFNPARLILGGGLVGSNRIVEEAVRAALQAHVMPGLREGLEVRLSGLGSDGSALGSACLAAAGVFGE